MNVISKPARQALVGWGDQEEQGLTVNGVKLAGKLPLKMPINSEPSCFTSYPIIRSNYKMSPNHRSGNSWIHMYILYIYIHIYTYTNILVSLGCVPLRATVERVSLPKNVRILGAHWHPERGPHPIRQQKIESCPYWPFLRWFSGKWMPPPVLLRKTLTMFHGKINNCLLPKLQKTGCDSRFTKVLSGLRLKITKTATFQRALMWIHWGTTMLWGALKGSEFGGSNGDIHQPPTHHPVLQLITQLQ